MIFEEHPVIVVVPPILAAYAMLIVIALASCRCSFLLVGVGCRVSSSFLNHKKQSFQLNSRRCKLNLKADTLAAKKKNMTRVYLATIQKRAMMHITDK